MGMERLQIVLMLKLNRLWALLKYLRAIPLLIQKESLNYVSIVFHSPRHWIPASYPSNSSDWGYIQQGKIALFKPGGKKYVFLSGESFVIADRTPAYTMENVGEGYAVMLVNAAAA